MLPNVSNHLSTRERVRSKHGCHKNSEKNQKWKQLEQNNNSMWRRDIESKKERAAAAVTIPHTIKGPTKRCKQWVSKQTKPYSS